MNSKRPFQIQADLIRHIDNIIMPELERKSSKNIDITTWFDKESIAGEIHKFFFARYKLENLHENLSLGFISNYQTEYGRKISEQQAMSTFETLRIFLELLAAKGLNTTLKDQNSGLFLKPTFDFKDKERDVTGYLGAKVQGFSYQKFLDYAMEFADTLGAGRLPLQIVGYNQIGHEEYATPKLFVTSQNTRPEIKYSLGSSISQGTRKSIPSYLALNSLRGFLIFLQSFTQNKGLEFSLTDQTGFVDVGNGSLEGVMDATNNMFNEHYSSGPNQKH